MALGEMGSGVQEVQAVAANVAEVIEEVCSTAEELQKPSDEPLPSQEGAG